MKVYVVMAKWEEDFGDWVIDSIAGTGEAAKRIVEELKESSEPESRFKIEEWEVKE